MTISKAVIKRLATQCEVSGETEALEKFANAIAAHVHEEMVNLIIQRMMQKRKEVRDSPRKLK